MNFLDVQVIRQGNKIVTDLYTKPTDTHQLLHRSSCHPGHTKKGMPYRQALRIRRICSEHSFFENRLGNLENFLSDQGYNRGEIEGQFNRVKGLDRNTLLDRKQNHRDDTRITLVLTFHPAFHKVCEILQKRLNALFVDNEHRRIFKDMIFVSFRRAKNIKDTLVRAKVYQPTDEQAEKGTFKCNGRRSCQICALIVEGEAFQNSNESRSFTISSGAYHCNSENVVYLLQCDCCNKKFVGSTKTKFRQRCNVYKSYFRTYYVNIMRAALKGVRRYLRRVFLGISLAKAIRVHFRLA